MSATTDGRPWRRQAGTGSGVVPAGGSTYGRLSRGVSLAYGWRSDQRSDGTAADTWANEFPATPDCWDKHAILQSVAWLRYEGSLRILHVTPSFCPAWAYGGVPRCAYELCRVLARAGEAVTVWTTDALDAAQRVRTRTATVDGIEVHYFPNLSNRLAYHLQTYLPRGLARQARTRLRQFDVVHIHSHRHVPELLVARAARRLGLPYVCTANGTVPAIERHVMVKRIVDVLGARAVLQGAAACVAVSEAEVAHYRRAGVAPGRITQIPNGVRLEAYQALPPRGTFRRAHGLAASTPLLVFVGKITPRKGVDVLVRALAQLPAAVHLVVGGNFMMPAQPIHRLAATLGLSDRIHFTGLLGEQDKLAAYVDADVVAYPSADEIFGLVPAEALMCGAPVVVCDDCGCGEFVRAAGGGLLVPYGDPAALAGALRLLLEDPARRAACATDGRRWVEEHLGWDRIAAQTRTLYESVITTHK
ncbi:MAG: glycosyltransferase [Candidatus Binatia bacterium]